MSIELIVLLGLATWRVSSMIVNESGPFDVFLKLRSLAGIKHDENGKQMEVPSMFFAQLFSCVWCSSMWVAAFWVLAWYILPSWVIPAALLCAGSAIAIILDKWLN